MVQRQPGEMEGKDSSSRSPGKNTALEVMPQEWGVPLETAVVPIQARDGRSWTSTNGLVMESKA